VGGRVLTAREPFAFHQHAEAGADLIDESQTEICRLIRRTGLRLAEILPGGFSPVQLRGSGLRVGGKNGWLDLQKRLQPEVRAFCLSEQRWDSGIAEVLAKQSVADWLDRVNASKALRDVALGLRGFFLADPDRLSCYRWSTSSPRRRSRRGEDVSHRGGQRPAAGQACHGTWPVSPPEHGAAASPAVLTWRDRVGRRRRPAARGAS
jgi:hypothetical protein